MGVRELVRGHWAILAIAVVVTALMAAIVLVLRTMPPRSIAMATGPEGGAYYQIGKRYQTILSQSGVQLRLVSTNGALENLELLRDPHSGVSVALLQGGITTDADSPEIQSLGTVFYEPLWLFQRSELRSQELEHLRGRKVSIGTEGGASRALALELLERSGIDGNSAQLLGYAPQDARDKLLAGEIDAALMVMSWESPLVQQLLTDERVQLASFPAIDAYAALYPFLKKVVVPAGLGDLTKHRPSSNVTLLAPRASLVVRGDTHSAIQYLLLNVARQVHSSPSIFRYAGEFPAAEALDVPLSDEAAQFYKAGRPFLQNYLPFWMAALVARLLVLLIPIVGVIYPVVRFVPAIYGWVMRRKTARLHEALRFIEDDLQASAPPQDAASTLARLNRIEQLANELRLPTAYASMQYMLRHHISLVRERLMTQRDEPTVFSAAEPRQLTVAKSIATGEFAQGTQN